MKKKNRWSPVELAKIAVKRAAGGRHQRRAEAKIERKTASGVRRNKGADHE